MFLSLLPLIILLVLFYVGFLTIATPTVLAYPGKLTSIDVGDPPQTRLKAGDPFLFVITFDASFYGEHTITNDTFFDFRLVVPGIEPWKAKDSLGYNLASNEPMVNFDNNWNLLDVLYVDSESGINKVGPTGSG